MKNLETLLRRHYEGVITPEEQSELDRLTHREQVISAASKRAKVLRRRQLAAATGMASVLLVAGALFFVHPSLSQSESNMPLMAQVDESVASDVEKTSSSPQPIVTTSESQLSAVDEQDTQLLEPKPHSVSLPVETPEHVEMIEAESECDLLQTALPDCEPIVACNTACSPDSVINDIWKFLRT